MARAMASTCTTLNRLFVTKPSRYGIGPIKSPLSRWMSNNNEWKPGSSWRKVSKSEYPKHFNSESKFRFPNRREITEFIFKGPKFLRVPESVSKIKGLRLGRMPQTKDNRQSYLFSIFRLFYNFNRMDTSSRHVMLFYRPTAFTVFFTASSYIGCTVWSHEDSGHRQLSSGLTIPAWRSSSSGDGAVTTILGWVTDNLRDARKRLRYWWNYQATEADKLFWPICALNGMVFLAWRLDVIAMSLVTYFAASPTSRYICWPMVLSTFSHYSFIHLAMNMFVLHSFLPSAVAAIGKYDTLFLYLSGGVIASYGSHLFKVFKGLTAPSIGASGAIMALLGFVCSQHPDAKLGIVFIPGLSFSADTGLKCLMAVDTAGLIFGWKFLDHAAHLSGMLYGILFCHMHPHLEPLREVILKSWRQIRG